MKRLLISLLALVYCAGAFAQWEIDPADYKISRKDLRRAQEILAKDVPGFCGRAMPGLGSPCGTQPGPLPGADGPVAGTSFAIEASSIRFPNPAPGAQWYPEAGLGLFIHWGIHSMLGAQPSWNMIKGYKWGGEYHSREE